MKHKRIAVWTSAALMATLFACSDEDSASTVDSNGTTSNGTTATSNGTTATSNGTTATSNGTTSNDPNTAALTHSFGAYMLAPGEEVQPCVAWTLNNTEAIYVEKVTMSNNGAFHHSNWFVVPDTLYTGDDGYFNCNDRSFTELASAVAGTVLFAQSTQSLYEEQSLGEGIVIKIPPGHKIVGALHLLNLAPRAFDSELRMSLDLIHPRKVNTVVTPFRLTYSDLDIPANGKSRFTGTCTFADGYEQVANTPLDLKLYWALPHYHYLGDYFKLEIFGGDRDGEILYELDGFNAEANGEAFTPPIDFTGAQGLKFTCGYNNTTDKAVGWGIGDQEMCVMLGFADSAVLMDAQVNNESEMVGMENGMANFEGPCNMTIIPKNQAQTLPTPEEMAADLYVPTSTPEDSEILPVDACKDANPQATAEEPATLTSVFETIFLPSCTFSSCHDMTPVAALDLTFEGLHGRLMAHQPIGNTDMPLVDPGNPEGSWLYHRMAFCEPDDKDGGKTTHMPLNAPTLMDDALLAKLYTWIEDGAQDN